MLVLPNHLPPTHRRTRATRWNYVCVARPFSPIFNFWAGVSAPVLISSSNCGCRSRVFLGWRCRENIPGTVRGELIWSSNLWINDLFKIHGMSKYNYSVCLFVRSFVRSPALFHNYRIALIATAGEDGVDFSVALLPARPSSGRAATAVHTRINVMTGGQTLWQLFILHLLLRHKHKNWNDKEQRKKNKWRGSGGRTFTLQNQKREKSVAVPVPLSHLRLSFGHKLFLFGHKFVPVLFKYFSFSGLWCYTTQENCARQMRPMIVASLCFPVPLFGSLFLWFFFRSRDVLANEIRVTLCRRK